VAAPLANDLHLYLPDQARYIRCIFELLNASSHVVKYEAATTSTTLAQNPTAVKGMARISSYHSCLTSITPSCHVPPHQLGHQRVNNNIKCIVLDHLDTLRSKHGHILGRLIMDILQVLSRLVRISYLIPTLVFN
jgi:coatomer subunit beta